MLLAFSLKNKDIFILKKEHLSKLTEKAKAMLEYNKEKNEIVNNHI